MIVLARIIVLALAFASTAVGWLISFNDPETGWRAFGSVAATLSAVVVGCVLAVVFREWHSKRLVRHLLQAVPPPRRQPPSAWREAA